PPPPNPGLPGHRPSRDPASRPALVVAGLLGLGVLLVLAVVDPSIPGRYPPCPVRALSGLWCPGCGGLRAGHALTRGDLPAALRANALVPVLALTVLLVPPLRTIRRRLRPPEGRARGRTRPGRGPGSHLRRPGATIHLLVGVVVLPVLTVFTVLRNLPVGAFLAP
ncbi:DUF2752 domain-containing protein, partial [Streptomyces alkaliphilus]